MSSEESDFEDEPGTEPGTLRTRGYLWRSTRLLRFYEALDNEAYSERANQPRRGLGRKGRTAGPPKEGRHLPPKGVASWMVSKRWVSANLDIRDELTQLIQDPAGYDWNQPLNQLGLESDDEHQIPSLQPHPHHYSTDSSLHYALA